MYQIGRKGKFFIRNEEPFFKCGYPPAPVQTLRDPSEHQLGQRGGGRGRNKLKGRDIERRFVCGGYGTTVRRVKRIEKVALFLIGSLKKVLMVNFLG